MRKAVITLLVLLPLVLVVIIAIAGRIYGTTEYVSPTSVYFVDEDNNQINNLSISVGEQQQLYWVVMPELVTNKDVSFTSRNTSICTVSSSGVVEGISTGQTVVTISTRVDNLTATIIINVSSSGATSMTISEDFVAYVGGYAEISAVTSPAEDTKSITWKSSDENVVKIVSVSSASGGSNEGKGGFATLSFVGTGKATITASEGNLSVSCEIEVVDGGVKFSDETNYISIVLVDNATINLLEYIVDSSGNNVQDTSSLDISFEVISGSNYAEINGNKLTLKSGTSGTVIVKVKLINNSSSDSTKTYFEKSFMISISTSD